MKKKVFFSYSKKDLELRNELDVFLSPTKDKIRTWHDRDLLAGTEWHKVIQAELHDADIYLCLLSPDFFATDYIMNDELPVILERRKRGEAVIIPIVVRPCGWEDTEFSAFQALPEKGKAVTLYENRDEAWHLVFEGIKKLY